MKSENRPLPKSVYYKQGSYYFVALDSETKKYKWNNLGRTWGAAFARYNTLVPQIKNDAYLKKRLDIYQRGGVPTVHLEAMLKQSRNNARSRDLEHGIDMPYLEYLAAQSGGRCALSGIVFEYGIAKETSGHSTRRKRPWAPSIDRIDSAGGYTKGNIRLVCIAVNVARSDFPDSVLIKIAGAIANMQKPQQIERAKSMSYVASKPGIPAIVFPGLS